MAVMNATAASARAAVPPARASRAPSSQSTLSGSSFRQPSNEMPPYEAGVVSDAEAANIYAYLQSLPEAKAAKDIPLLNQ